MVDSGYVDRYDFTGIFLGVGRDGCGIGIRNSIGRIIGAGGKMVV